MIDVKLASLLRCPACDAAVSLEGGAATCDGCGVHYAPSEHGVPDLRLRAPKTVPHTYTVGEDCIAALDPLCKPMEENTEAQVEFSDVEVPLHFSRELLSHVPRAPGADALALDLGCGSGVHRGVCERAGFGYVGVDIASPDATLLADAHALPFQDASFDFVLSVAVLEHLQYPVLAVSEIARILKPGGVFLGTVAFLEPFHGNSFYHHTHLGTANSLQSSGLEVEFVSPNEAWPATVAITSRGLFPKLPGALVRAGMGPVNLLHRAWWYGGRAFGQRFSKLERLRKTTGAFYFRAHKPAA